MIKECRTYIYRRGILWAAEIVIEREDVPALPVIILGAYQVRGLTYNHVYQKAKKIIRKMIKEENLTWQNIFITRLN